MNLVLLRRRVAGLGVTCLLLGACADPDVSVKATDFGDDSVYYLILSDQLLRVRNVLKEPATVCATVELHDGIAPLPPDMLDRIASEQANNEIPLTVASTYECLVHYTRNKRPFTPEETDILVLARHQGGGFCGEWFGGMFNQANLNRGVYYDLVVEEGIARLTGGRNCASSLRWYRT